MSPVTPTARPSFEHSSSESQIASLQALHRAGLAIVEHLDPIEISSAIARELESLLPYERTLVAELDEAGRLTVLAHAGRDVEHSRAECERVTALLRENPRRGVIRWVADHGESVRIDDVRTDDRYVAGDDAIRSELCVPMIHRDRVVGVLNVESSRADAFSDVDEMTLSALGSSVAVALENARLYQALNRQLAEREVMQAAIVASEHRYQALFERAGEGIQVLVNGAIALANERAGDLLPAGEPRCKARPFVRQFEESERAAMARALDDIAGSGRRARFENVATAGEVERWVNVTMSSIDWHGERAVLCFVSDVTRARQMTRRLRHEATHDAMTGLVNRREFESRAGWLIGSIARSGGAHVMGYLDLDRFKVVNDSCGHAAGDELLIVVARALGDAVRAGDTLARLGGDEFGILLTDCSVEDALRIATGMRQAVHELRFGYGDRVYRIGVSIGLVEIGNDLSDTSAVLRAADAACYIAKENGRGEIHVYRDDDDRFTRRGAEMRMLGEVRAALDTERLQLHFQHIAPLSPEAGGARIEILSRLRGEDGAMLDPGSFLPAIERHGLHAEFDLRVVERTVEWLDANPARRAELRQVSINLSARSLGDRALLARIVAIVEASSVDPGTLCFEITETAAMRDRGDSVHFMHELRRLGCRFALDDFGAGLCSFGYLRDLPVDTLKIDGSFVRTLPGDATNLALVSAMHSLARTLGLETVGEFAETPEIVATLRTIGIDFAQGYAISRPLPLEDLADAAPGKLRHAI